MEEITVTARKREEGLQDTPIAVSVFSGESLEARGVQRVDEIAGLTPNMSFDNINTNGGGGNSAAVFLRGVGQRDFLPSADPGVGIYVDGVYYARSIGSVLDIIDVDRIEVLRGPQSTLFGRYTTGGAIAIHTVKPHEEFEGKMRVRVGIDDWLDVLGKVNVPVSDKVFMNATVAKFDQDGFVVNLINGLDTGDDDTLALRGAVRWLANNNVEINLSGDYSRDRENGSARVAHRDPTRVIHFIPPDPNNPSTSTHEMHANQLRLYFSSFAYVLIQTLRRLALQGTALARAQCGTIRLKLLKVGVQVRISVRKVWLAFAESYPYAALFRQVLTRLQAIPLRC